MTKLLAIDSSTEACSVALSVNGEYYNKFQFSPRKHAELLLPMIDTVLSQAKLKLSDLDAIACCVGPGAFTGLRIAISMAQSLGYAISKPCIAVSSLQLLAAEAFNSSHSHYCLSSIDARMKEVYFGAFQRGGDGLPVAISEERVISPLDIQVDSPFLVAADLKNFDDERVAVAGSGWAAYDYDNSMSTIKQIETTAIYPNAYYMLPIAEKAFAQGEIINASKMRPSYLRNNVAKKKSSQN